VKKIASRWYWLIVLGFLVFATLVFFITGTDSIIAVHDNLDLFMPQYQMMKDTHSFFTWDATVDFLCGLSRDYLPSEINLYTLLYAILPGYYAYIVGYLLKIIIAIVGAALLAIAVMKEKAVRYRGIIILTGFAYGILNLFPNFGICFASVPLLCYILYKIVSKEKYTVFWYVLLLFYPFLSYFSYFGIFLIGFLLLYFIGRTIAKRKFQGRILISAIVLSAGYVLCEYRLFLTMLYYDTESIRKSMVIETMDAKGVLSMIWEGIAKGDMHTEALQYKFVMPVCLLFFVYQIIIYIKNKELKKIFKDPLFLTLLFIVFNGFIYGIYYCGPVRELFDKCIPPLAGFQFTRAEYFNPFLWYFMLFIVVKRIYDIGFIKDYLGKVLAYVILMVTIFVTVLSGTRYNDLYHTCLSNYHQLRSGEKNNDLSFKEFYSEKLFDKALEDIDYHGEWAVAYGLYPAILEYNGIKTLDGYLGYYSDGYKAVFRKVIAPALAKMPESAAYYDNWGARCTLYSGTYTTNVTAGRYYDIENEDIYIDTDAFKYLGGRYIFSRVNITNAEDAGFELAGTYTDDESPYTLYVYRTISWYQNKEHSDVAFADRSLPEYDSEGITQKLNTWQGYIDEANALKNENPSLTDEEIVDKIGHKDYILSVDDELPDIIGDIDTAYNMAEILYYKDVTSDEYSDIKSQIYSDYMDIGDLYLVTLRETVKSPYIVTLREKYSERELENYSDYEDLTDEEKERALKIQSLSDEYLQAYNEEYYFDYNGTTWSFEMLEENYESLEREDVIAIYSGLYEQKMLVVGDIFTQLVKLRNEMAVEEGYDNFAEYSYEESFNRDYTVDDTKDLLKMIRKKGAAYLQKISGLGSEVTASYEDLIQGDVETYEKLLPYFEDINPELGTSLRSIINLGLCDMLNKKNKRNAGFTTPLGSFGDAFIFDSPTGSYSDLFTMVHEFGHYSADYYNNEGTYHEITNMDTAEIESQGLEMLFTEYYSDIYGEEIGDALEAAEVDSIASALVDEAIIVEFEIYVYEHPDETVEEYSRQYKDILESYGYTTSIINSTGGSDVWMDTTHIFVAPNYYISYITTGITALEIYSLSKKDREEAITKYMEITQLPSRFLYLNAIHHAGLTNIFEGDNAIGILKDTYYALSDLEN